MTDASLHDNINKTLTEMQQLLAEIKKDPKKIPECENVYLLGWLVVGGWWGGKARG